MSKQVIAYFCMVCDESFSIIEPAATVQYCPYCGEEEPSKYSYSEVGEGADAE